MSAGKYKLAMILLALMVPVPVFAQETQAEIDALDQLMNTEVTTVTGASKYQQEISDAPASITIVTNEDIHKGGFRNLAETLNSVRGFYVTNNRRFQTLGVRGSSPLGDVNSRILLLLDGHRLNDGLFEAAAVGIDFPVDLDLIDRIEVIRGPGSSLYGTNAFFAVINVITRNGKDLKGGELSGSGGSFNSWTGRATGGGKLASAVDVLLSGSYRSTDGQRNLSFPEYSVTNNGIAHGLDGETTYDFMAKASWRDFSFLALHQNKDKTVPTASYGSIFNDPGQVVNDQQTLAGLTYQHASGFVDVNARVTYNRYQSQSDYPVMVDEVKVQNRDSNLGEWVGSDFFVSKSVADHFLTLGMEHRWQFTQHLSNFDVSPPADGTNINKTNLIQGYYVQDEYHVNKQLILNAGIRLDNYYSFGNTFNPRAALIWKPEANTVLRLTYGEAFRAPNAYELYYADKYNMSQKGNEFLKPEKLRTVEFGWEQYFGENIRTSASGFYTHVSDLLEQIADADGVLVFTNQRKSETKGVELQVDGKWENGCSGRLSYAYQDSKNIGTSDPVVNSPQNLVKGSVTVPIITKKSFATLEMLHISSRLNSAFQKIDGSTIFNLTLLNRDLVKGLELSASIYNLFDTHYASPSGPEHFNGLDESLREITQDGITFRVKATYRF